MFRKRSISETLLALAVLLMLTTSGCGPVHADIPFSALLTEVKADNVSDVTIDKDLATATFKKPVSGADPVKRELTVLLPRGDAARTELVSLLEKHGVPFQFVDR
jgi:hypothetical protein